MANNKVLVGTVGRVIEVDTKIDLTPFSGGGSVQELLVQRPDRTETTWSAAFKDADPTNGILVHTLAAGEVAQKGKYLIHAHVVDPTATKDELGQMTVLVALAKFEELS